MAAGLVSPLINAIIPKVGSYIESQYNWRRDMKDDLTKLRETLLSIQMVVAAAERQQIMDQYQYELLRDLKDAIYEADDVLDEFEYQYMQVRAKKARDQVSYIASSSLRFAKRLVGQDKLRNQLREVLEKLKNINTRAQGLIPVLQLDRTIPSEQVAVNPNRDTSSIISEDRIFGRDKEKNEIVNLLLQQSADEPESSDSKPFQVISIVGIGGVGKTTLAQLVYNDTRVALKEHFELHMWICVSDRFDLYRLTGEMLLSVSQNSGEQQDFKNLPLNVLQTKLQTKLKSKRFLLVLDDVWMDEKESDFENKKMWEKLLAPLKDGAKGSKILVTTRMKKVADMFNKTNSIFLEGLEKDEYWQLFTRCAFGDKNENDYPELKDIANKIVIRLKGSPLAAKAIGNLLQCNLDCGEWNKILQAEAFDDINNILKLSYKHLPDHLKCCFAYCSIFPKDLELDREELAFLWVAQGYVQSRERDNRTEEEIGIDYFDELVSRSFFQKVEKDSSISYVMHDLMHDLAEHVFSDECFRIDGSEQRSIGRSIRHIGVYLDYNEHDIEDVWSKLEKMNNRKNMRTLIFVSHNWWDSIDLPSWFREVRSLRVLGFKVYGNFRGDIGHLVHLRYLDGGRTYMGSGSLSGLFHLKVVSGYLRHSKSLTELSKFGKLTHIFGHPLEFVVGKKRGVRDLKDIKLRGGGLSIIIVENGPSEVEAAEVDLEHHQFIEELQLSWGYPKRRIVGHDSEEKVVNALKPHPNLKELEIKFFGGRRCPSWLETNWLINLQSLSLLDCEGLEVMPPLGHLPYLKILKLSNMGSMERIGMEFYGDGNVKGFPSLEDLSFQYMPAWVEWSAPEFPVFPRLQILWVQNCPELKQFLSFQRAVEGLLALQELVIWKCPELKQFPSFPSLSSLQISSLSITDGCLSHWLQGLSSLSRLDIQNCNGLKSLPSAKVLHRLTALEEMSIHNCSELESLGGLHALPSLQELSVTYCNKLKSLPEEGLQGLSSLSSLEIEYCNGLTSLPSAEVLHRLTALQQMSIKNCSELASLGGLHALPSLEELSVSYCDKLLHSEWDKIALQELQISHCDVTDGCLSRCLQGLSSLSSLHISNCTGLTSLPSAEVLHRLTALQEMSIWSCSELASLGGLHALPSLHKLSVTYCNKLKSLPEEGLPPSIKDIKLSECHPELKEQICKKEGPEWDKIARIPSLQLRGSFS